MTTPVSFPISLSQARTEFGLGLPCVFPDDFYGKGGLPGSGSMDFSDLLGLSNVSPIQLIGVDIKGHNVTTTPSISYTTDFKDSGGATVVPAAGDFIIVWGVHAGTTFNNNIGNAVGSSTGTFTKVPAAPVLTAADSAYASGQMAYQFRGASASISLSGVNGVPDTQIHMAMAFRGVHATTPLDVTPTTATGLNTGRANAPSITPATAKALIVVLGGAAQLSGASGTNAFTAPSNMSSAVGLFKESQMLNGTDTAIAMALKNDWSSGAFDPAQFGGSTNTSNDGWVAMTLALRPA